MKTFINAPSEQPIEASKSTVLAMLRQLDHYSQWIGIKLSSRWTMQFRPDADENNEKIYMELLDTKSKTFKWKVLSFKEAESLVKEVLGHGKPSQHFRKLAKAWKEEDLNGVEPDDVNEEDELAPLGHGDHWEAMGLKDGKEILVFIDETFRDKDERIHEKYIPFEYEDEVDVLWVVPRLADNASIRWVQLLGATTDYTETQKYRFLSAFPSFTRSTKWLMKFSEENDAYGPFERVLEVDTVSGHHLECFGRDYGGFPFRLVEDRIFVFEVNALALSMELFPAEPIVIKDGPNFENEKKRRIDEGDEDVANDPDFALTFTAEEFRCINISSHDHVTLTGKIMEATPIKPQPRFKGWRLRIECLPETGFERDLIVYAFPPCLDKGYRPRKNDLITATVWLQAKVDRAATYVEIREWEKVNAEWHQPWEENDDCRENPKQD
jgi:hypothetical protein